MLKRRPRRGRFEVSPQPDDVSCGPTCLHAVYRYYGDDVPLEQIIEEVVPLDTGGTLAVSLACHALRRGYDATIYTYNLLIFDPSWFAKDAGVDIAARLRAQRQAKSDRKLHAATRLYLEFLERGGKLAYEDLRPALIRRFLKSGVPILTGCSATYLYECPRELEDVSDDVRGAPVGHFVVVVDYDQRKREVRVADPLHEHPRFQSHYYRVPVERLIGAILLGIVTYDANLLLITPRERG